MARWRCSSPCRCNSGCCFLVLLLSAAAVAQATGYFFGKKCPSLDACRAGVPNQGCCKAVNDAIIQGECSYVCKQLKIYNQGQLAQGCHGKWCSRCGLCRCVNAPDGRGPYKY